MRRESPPTTKKIHDYWEFQANHNGKILAELVGDTAFENILEGDGECCYACGRPTFLQRCHIIPHALGGSQEPGNLFLLCSECHSNNPDTVFPEFFFKYVRSVPYYLATDFIGLLRGVNKHYNCASEEEKKYFDAVADLEPDIDDIKAMLEMYKDKWVVVRGRASGETRSALSWVCMVEHGEKLTNASSDSQLS